MRKEWLRQRELEDARACQAIYLAQFSKEIKAKEDKALLKEVGAYVNAHSDLLAELVKYYPEEDITQLEKLASGVKAESEKEEEREEGENIENVPKEQAREDPPVE